MTTASFDDFLKLDIRVGRITRAEPYPELDRHPAADAERARLADLRLAALADRARLHLALGQESTVVADLGPVAHDHPLREDLWALFALALARAGTVLGGD